jgi:hypothetical protein
MNKLLPLLGLLAVHSAAQASVLIYVSYTNQSNGSIQTRTCPETSDEPAIRFRTWRFPR